MSVLMHNSSAVLAYRKAEVDNMADDIKELKDLERKLSMEDGDFGEKGEESCGPQGSWFSGLILIAIGAFFLINNFTNIHLTNWWALFILIPAFGSLGSFVQAYNNGGWRNSKATGSLIMSFVFFFVAATFLFGWSWGTVWPVMLILGGLGALLSGFHD